MHLEGRLRPQGPPGRDDALEPQGLGDDVPHPHPLVQAGAGVLEDELAGGLQHPPVGSEGGSVAGVDSLVQNPAAPGPVEVHHAPGRRGLAGPGLPHQTKDLPPADLEGHVVHRPDGYPPIQGEDVGQMLDIQQNFLSHGLLLSAA